MRSICHRQSEEDGGHFSQRASFHSAIEVWGGVGEGWETDTAPAAHISQAPGVPFHLTRLEMFVPEEIMTNVSCGVLRCLTTGLWG